MKYIYHNKAPFSGGRWTTGEIIREIKIEDCYFVKLVLHENVPCALFRPNSDFNLKLKLPLLCLKTCYLHEIHRQLKCLFPNSNHKEPKNAGNGLKLGTAAAPEQSGTTSSVKVEKAESVCICMYHA